MPLEEVGIERLERPEQPDRRLDQPAEEDDADAEVRGRDRRRPVLAEERLDRRTVGGPAGRGDHEPTAAGVQRRGQVRDDGVGSRRLDDEAGTGQVGRIVPAAARPAEDPDRATAADRRAVAILGGRRDGTAEGSVAEDEHRVHVLVPSSSG